MKRFAFALLSIMTISAAPAAAKGDTVQEQLSKALEGWRTEMIKGDVAKALSYRSASVRKDLEQELAGADAEMFKAFLRLQAPDRYSVTRVGTEPGHDGMVMDLVATIDKVDFPPHPRHGQSVTGPLQVFFVKEGDAWKVHTFMFREESQQQAAPEDLFEPIESYNRQRQTHIGGRILRVAFEPKHTLVVLKFMDEEQLVYLPPRATLEKNGPKPSELVVGAVLQADGHPHASKNYKVYATSASVMR